MTTKAMSGYHAMLRTATAHASASVSASVSVTERKSAMPLNPDLESAARRFSNALQAFRETVDAFKESLDDFIKQSELRKEKESNAEGKA